MSYINSIIQGDALTELKKLPSKLVNCCVTSPPYYALRDYKHEGQIGQERTLDEYINKLVTIFNEVKRVLKNTGTFFLVMGDTYAGTGHKGKHKDPKYRNGRNGQIYSLNYRPKGYQEKSAMMVPEKLAIRMIENGWILRNKIIWHKRNVTPSPAMDRFTVDYENIYFFVKSQRYYFKTQYRPYADSTLREAVKKYNGQGLKDYKGNKVQNPSDTKRRIIESVQYNSKYIESGVTNYVNVLEIREKSRQDALLLFPGNLSMQKRYIKHVHDHYSGKGSGNVFGGTKFRGYGNRLYSGKEWYPNSNGSMERTVWTINTDQCGFEHFAVFPEELVTKCIDAGCPVAICNRCKRMKVKPMKNYTHSGIVLDPFMGKGTTALAALKMNRRFVGIELNKEYIEIADFILRPLLD